MIRSIVTALLTGLYLTVPAIAQPRLTLTSDVIWKNERAFFGGFSGLEVSAGGNQMTIINDQGVLVRASVVRQNGAIHTVQITQTKRLKDEHGNTLIDASTDSEGFAIDAQGQAYVSFEERHRIATLDLKTGQTELLPNHPAFAQLRKNAGLEALAVHPDGTLYTLPETTITTRGAFSLYALQSGKWHMTAKIPRRGPFLPVGADFSQNGHLYLLERAATPLGFRSRIRRFDLTSANLGETTLIRSMPGRFDNLEAISVWQDDAGQTHLTLLSDDNFLKIQRTQIVEYTLTD